MTVIPTRRLACFVIMPFSGTSPDHTEDYWTDHFRTFLKPLIERDGRWVAHRSTAIRGDIVKELVSDLVTSPVVLAELTDANPNVYWELGVRQSFKHGTVTIAEAGTRLPFDISAKGTLFYHPKNHLKLTEFVERLQAALENCISDPERPDSHVLDTLSGRGTIYELVRRDEAIRRVDALVEEIRYDLRRIASLVERAQKNQEAESERTFPTTFLRLSCVELLMTTRYVERDTKFYKLVENAFDRISTINGQVMMWEHSPEDTEKWLLGSYERAVKTLNNLLETLTTLASELAQRK